MNRLNTFVSLCIFATLILSACAAKPAISSQDSPTGKWSGEYGPSPDRRDPVSLDLNWDGGKLKGTVHAGPRTIPLGNSTFKPETGAIVIEFDAQGNGGRTVHYQVDGKIEGKTMTGSWTHDGERGDFRLTKE